MSLRSIDNFPSSRFPPTYVGFGILYILGNLIKAKIMRKKASWGEEKDSLSAEMQSADSEESKSDQSMSHRRESQASSLSPPFGKDSVRLLQNLHLDKSGPQELQPSLRCHRCEEDLLDRVSWSSYGSPPCKIPLERNFLWT